MASPGVFLLLSSPLLLFSCVAVCLQMMCLEHSASIKQTEFETKLRTLEESQRKVLNKLRDDMTSQQRSANQLVSLLLHTNYSR